MGEARLKTDGSLEKSVHDTGAEGARKRKLFGNLSGKRTEKKYREQPFQALHPIFSSRAAVISCSFIFAFVQNPSVSFADIVFKVWLRHFP